MDNDTLDEWLTFKDDGIGSNTDGVGGIAPTGIYLHDCKINETDWNVINGEKVWSEEKECEGMTWRECKPVETEADFSVVGPRSNINPYLCQITDATPGHFSQKTCRLGESNCEMEIEILEVEEIPDFTDSEKLQLFNLQYVIGDSDDELVDMECDDLKEKFGNVKHEMSDVLGEGGKINDLHYMSTDIKQGYVAPDSKTKAPCGAQDFTAQVIVQNHSGQICNNYSPGLDCHTANTTCKFNEILEEVDSRTGKTTEVAPNFIKSGDAGIVRLEPSKPMCVEASDFPPLGHLAFVAVHRADVPGSAAATVDAVNRVDVPGSAAATVDTVDRVDVAGSVDAFSDFPPLSTIQSKTGELWEPLEEDFWLRDEEQREVERPREERRIEQRPQLVESSDEKEEEDELYLKVSNVEQPSVIGVIKASTKKDDEEEKPTKIMADAEVENILKEKRFENEDDYFDGYAEDVEIISKTPKKIGDPGNDKCKYDLIREGNIKEIQARMSKYLAEIQKESRELVAENENKTKANNGGKTIKKKKSTKKEARAMRKSDRQRKPVNYNDEDKSDPDWEPEGKKKRRHKIQRKSRWDGSNDHLEDGNLSEDQPSGSTSETGRRSSRPRTEANYIYEDVPREDAYIFCQWCNEPKLHGCNIHPPIFNYDVDIELGKSGAGKNAGRGIFNKNPCPIPEGVMFGPYTGEIYTRLEYNRIKKINGESGYAWILRDPFTGGIVGYVDPGPNPDPNLNWMSMVNCSSKTRHQNLMACQYLGEIYYRTVDEIHFFQELLVYYGNDYARDIMINVAERDFFELHEDWQEEGVNCPHCNTCFTTKEDLQKHIANSEKGGIGGCRVLRTERIQREVEAGERPFICSDCGMGFKWPSELDQHKSVHSDAKPFVCSDCGKSFTAQRYLKEHTRGVHSGLSHPCPTCGKIFKNPFVMNRHRKTYCLVQEKPFKCDECGKKFSSNAKLTLHIKGVHNRELPHSCDVCGKRFFQKNKIKVHMDAVHNNARPFKCDECGSQHKNKTHLKNHIISAHTKEYKWNCEICKKNDVVKGFIQQSKLKKHMQTNHYEDYKIKLENENPAVCPKCPKRFPSLEQLEIHKKKMHP